MSALATEVFGVSHYSNKTLLALYDALLANPDHRKITSWEANRLRVVREEMQRRGICLERSEA